MNVDDVKRLHAEQVLKGKSAKDAYNGVRTLVQLALHEESPSPYPLDPPTKLFIQGRQPTDAEKALGIPIAVGIELTAEQEKAFNDEARAEFLARVVKRATSARPEHVTAHQIHVASGSPGGPTVDGVHFAEKEHQSALWRQGDALVRSALGECP